METIEVKEHGLIEHISLPVRPGVNIFRGPTDCGKSVLLEGLSRTLGNQRAKAACRTGQKQGSITGMGVQLTVSKRTTVKGVLVVDSIEGRYTVADLVDPHIKDPAAADTKRIHALLSLNGAESDPAKFHGLLPGGREEFERRVGPVEGSGLVELAGGIKRKLEWQAREESSRAADFNLQAEACRLAYEGVDTSVETDTEKLQTAFEEAVKREAALESLKKTSDDSARAGREASRQLGRALADYKGKTVEEAKDRLRLAAEALCQKDETLAAAEKALAAADNLVQRAHREMREIELESEAAEGELTAAANYVRVTAGWKETIDEALGSKAPTSTELVDAESAVTTSREAIEIGAIARDASEKEQQAIGHLRDYHAHEEAAESLRQAAIATDDVLSEAVDSDVLTVVGGRLMTPTDDRGLIPFGERSQGYRASIAISEAIKLIKAQGTHETAIIPLPQELWEGLQPKIKKAIDAQAREAGVTIYTAEAVDEELHVSEFGK